MTPETLRALLLRRPFDPFRLTMSSGAAFEVRHPEMASIGKTSMLVILPDPDGGPSDRWEFLPFAHIAHVQTASAEQAA